MQNCAAGVIAFGSQSQLTKHLFGFERQANAQTASQIPLCILYNQIFRLVVSFKNKTKTQEVKGESITEFKNYFKDEVRLTDRQNEILEQVAAEFIQEIQPIDARAGVLITQARQAFPNGVVPAGSQVSSELTNLQTQRNNLALQYRSRLNELLGNDKFNELDNFVQGNFASKFQTTPLTPQTTQPEVKK